MSDFDAAIHEIGTKGDLTKAAARKAALNFVRATALMPDIEHSLCLGGFDDDPREIWDIPEAREFVRRFAGWVVVVSGQPAVPLHEWRLDEASVLMVAVCTGLGRLTGRDPATGNWLAEIGDR